MIFTDGALATLVERRGVVFILGVGDLNLPLLGVDAAIAPVARGEHTIKRVYPRLHSNKNIFRLADAE